MLKEDRAAACVRLAGGLLLLAAAAAGLSCFNCNQDLKGQPPADTCESTASLKADPCIRNETACFTRRITNSTTGNFSHYERGCHISPSGNMMMDNYTDDDMDDDMSMYDMNYTRCDLHNNTCLSVCSTSACNDKPTPLLQCAVCNGTMDPSCSNVTREHMKQCPPDAVACYSEAQYNQTGYVMHVRGCATVKTIQQKMASANNRGCMVDSRGYKTCFGYCGRPQCNNDTATSTSRPSSLWKDCLEDSNCTMGNRELCMTKGRKFNMTYTRYRDEYNMTYEQYVRMMGGMPPPDNKTGMCDCGMGYRFDVMFNCVPIPPPPGKEMTTMATGTYTMAYGTYAMPNGTYTMPNGTYTMANGTYTMPNGTYTMPNGTYTMANGTYNMTGNTTQTTAAMSIAPNVTTTAAKTVQQNTTAAIIVSQQTTTAAKIVPQETTTAAKIVQETTTAAKIVQQETTTAAKIVQETTTAAKQESATTEAVSSSTSSTSTTTPAPGQAVSSSTSSTSTTTPAPVPTGKPCDRNPCGTIHTCTNIDATRFTCTCADLKRWYQDGTKTFCANVNECSDPTLNDCGDPTRAICQDIAPAQVTDPGYKCSCREGYVAQGKLCISPERRFPIPLTSMTALSGNVSDNKRLPFSFPLKCGSCKEFYITQDGQLWCQSIKPEVQPKTPYASYGSFPSGPFAENLWSSPAELLVMPYMTMLEKSSVSGSGVYYSLLERPGNSTLLDDIGLKLSGMGGKVTKPNACIIVDYRAMQRRGLPQNNVTFQALICSDSINTEILFVYEDTKMNYNYQLGPTEIRFPAYVGAVCKPSKPGMTLALDEWVYSGAKKDSAAGQQCIKRPDTCTYNGSLPSPTNINKQGLFLIAASNNTPSYRNPSIACKEWQANTVQPTAEMLAAAAKCPAARALVQAGIWAPTLETVPGYSCFQRIKEPPHTVNQKTVWVVIRCCFEESGDGKTGVIGNSVKKNLSSLPINTLVFVVSDSRPNKEQIAAAVATLQQAYMDCCVNETDQCDAVFNARVPVTNAKNAPQCGGSNGAGDPHFKSFDGKGFTFNGLGEFSLVSATIANLQDNTKYDKFIAQVGTKQRQPNDPATVFHKVVAQQQVQDDTQSSDLVEFWLNASSTGIDVYQNKKLVDITTTTFNDVNVEERNGYYIMGFPRYGFVIEAAVDKEMISFSVITTQQNPGMTFTGLLGNYDGNPDNDFVKRDGTPAAGTTEANIYEMGLTWCVDQASTGSMFETPDSPSCDTSFIPVYADALDWTGKESLQQDAIKACGDNQACLYDIYITNDVSVGESTKNQSQVFTSEQTIRTNIPPAWESPEITVNVTKGVNFSQTFTATDGDQNTLTYMLQDQPNLGKMTVSAQGQLTWTGIPDLEGQGVTAFFDVASDGFIAVPLQINIRFCKCDNLHGNCSWDSGSGGFAVVGCKCQLGWAQPYCDVDENGCQPQPCFPGVTCTDVAAQDIKSPQSPKFTCGPCPAGYTGDGVVCDDSDECKVPANNACDKTIGTCTNTAGSYSCGCQTGYMLAADKTTCKDVDECVVNKPCDPATSVCENLVGSYRCNCNAGYTTKNGQCVDIDECTAGTDTCDDNTTICENIAGSYDCKCKPGFTKSSPTDSKCVQIDDCVNANCTQICTDKTEGYTCSCEAGFEVVAAEPWKCQAAAGSTCTPDEITLQCPDGACAKVNGILVCRCPTGTRQDSNTKRCTDINECAEALDRCDRSRGSCVNKAGGYTCTCNAGYRLDVDGYSCLDVNECTEGTDTCDDVHGTCTNNAGSYTCSCQAGWTLPAGSSTCVDVDECAQANKGGCDASYGKCSNLQGSYTCQCNIGYSGNGYQCTDLDECANSNGGCSQNCQNTMGSYRCACLAGYTLSSDARTCNDIDECAQNTDTCTDTCTNTQGSYRCSCPADKRLLDDGATCVSVTQCADGNGCEYACTRTNNQDVCTCQPGYKLGSDSKSCVDKDECAESGATLCPAANNVKCVNSVGSYSCECTDTTTFIRDSATSCSDKDECATNNGGCASPAVCVNKQPGYLCACSSAYKMDANGNCIDIDECSNSSWNKCSASTNATCINAIGGYACQCQAGFQLTADTYNCQDIDECTGAHGCDPVRGICINTPGSYSCGCKSGYSASSATTCSNINECLGVHGCQHICQDTEGSYGCACQPGYTLNADGKTCQVDQACGTNQCNQLCAKISGVDTCFCYNTSYKLSSDNKICLDVDECAATTSPCKGTAGCENQTPGYKCYCKDGYKLNPDGVSCIDRDGGWSAWTADWSACSKKCGIGSKNRTRQCDNPTKQGSGNNCSGVSVEYESCNTQACPLSDVEMRFGVQASYVTIMTVAQYSRVDLSMRKLVAQKINEYCRANSSKCCKNPKSNIAADASIATYQDVKYGGSSPYRDGDKLVLVFLIVVPSDNDICNATTNTVSRKRREVLYLMGNETAVPQEVLMAILQSQDVKDKVMIIVSSEFAGTVTIDANSITVTAAQQPAQPDDTDNQVEESKRPGWVIPVAVVLSVLALIIIILVIVIIVKRPTKVEDQDSKQKDA